MRITIYDPVGNPKAYISPNDNSTQVKEIQGDNILTLSFTHYDHIGLDVGDYADYLGERYWLTEKYRPKQESTKEWVYDIRLYGIESLVRNILVIKTVDNEDEPVFTLTAPPRDHVDLIVKCMNSGMGNMTDWKAGRVEGNENIVIDYFGKHCDEALRELAEKTGAECWVEGQTVNICKCEHGEPLTLGYNKGLLSIDPGTADNARFYTRLYPVGSSRNIDREIYGHSRLQLPGGQRYVEINAEKYGRVDHYEQSAFENIFPRRIGVVGSVRSETREGEDGTQFAVYYFTDSSLTFDPNDYEIGGLVKRVSFQEGSELAGLGEEDNGTYYLEVNFNSDTREFEIITIWPYGNDIQLPGGRLVPKACDRYVLWNLRMPDEYYPLAEEEFMEAVNAYNREHAHDISVFKAATDHVWIEEEAADLSIGRRVRLESSEYFPETGFMDSRITKVTRKVSLPSQMDIEIGDVLGRTSRAIMNDEIRDVRMFAEGLGAAGSGLPDIIRTGDRTRPTDNNLFSALRIMRSFLSKLGDDRSKGAVASDVAMEVGNFVPGISGAKVWIDENGDTCMEADNLTARKKAFFKSLAVSETEYIGGELALTPGAGIGCTGVDEARGADGNVTGWVCWYMCKDVDGKEIHCRFKKGDFARCQTFNLGKPDADGSYNDMANRYYWRQVVEVGNPSIGGQARTDEQGRMYCYIRLSNVEGQYDPAGMDEPKAGDCIVQLGHNAGALGGEDDPARQKAIIISTSATASPSISMFTGIDTFSLERRMVIGLGRDEKGRVFFRLGADGDTQYLKYRHGNGLAVCGDISVESTVGGRPIGEVLRPETAYRLELTPNTGAVQCDAAGNITAEVEAMPYTLITVYKGNARLGEYDSATQAGYRLDSIEATAGVYFYRDTARPQGTYTMQKSAGMTADTATATFNVSVYENGTKVASLMAGMSIYKVRPGQGGTPGADGQPAIRLVLSQELIAVPCSADGEPLSGTFPIQVTASLFRGDKATEGTFRTQDEEGCTTTHSGSTLTVTEMTATEATFTAVGTETSTGASAQLNVSLYKVIPGADDADGEAAVVYALEPSVMAIRRDIDGTARPAAVSCTVYKTTGNADRQPTNDRNLYYKRIGATASNWVLISRSNGQSGQVIVTSTTEEVLFGLFGLLRPTSGTQPLAMARIPVLTDAADLEGSGVNLLRNTNQGTSGWTNDLYAAYAPGTGGEANPRPLPSLTESDSVPPGVVETNFYKYPFGKTSVSEMPTTVEYQMFFNLPEAIVLQKGRKYTLSFDARVAFRGTDLTLDYGINASPDRESLGTLAIGASVIRVQKTFTIGASADKSASSVSIYVRLANANVNGTGSYDGKGRSQFDSIVISNLKLEMGSLATRWTPAPGDMHYLTRAFRESTTLSGGVVMTARVRVGYTDNNGAWHETGGINGIATDYEGDVVPNAPILYCGGSMEDKGAPEYASSSTSATSMIRLDGSAYFANNTVRFRENTMEMGDYIVLQDDGLRLLDPASGEERLFITNGSVGTLSDIGSIAPQAVSGSLSGITMHFYRQTQGGTGLALLPGYYLKSIYPADSYIAINNGNAIGNANSTLSVTASISFRVPSWGSAMLMKASLAIVLQTAASGSYIWTDVALYPLHPASTSASLTDFAASADILAPLSKGRRYRLRLLCTNDEAPRFTANLSSVRLSGSATGSVKVSQRKTVLGNDGLATVWGNAAILVKENEVHLVQGLAKVDLQHAGLVISQGETTFELYDGTIRMTSVWGGKKTILNISSGGIDVDHPDVQAGVLRPLRLDKLMASGFFDW